MAFRTALVISVLIGAALELGVQALGSKREAWDSPAFWTVGMPVALGAALLVGVFSKARAWLATIAVAPAQFTAMTIRSGEVGGLWPLGLVLSTVLSLPFVAAAFAGSRVGRALGRR